MITLFFTFVGLIIPNVYAQEYNPTSDTYDSLINGLLPLLIISAYQSTRFKPIIDPIEIFLLWIFLSVFPPTYNFFIYKNTSTYDYVCMFSSLLQIPFFAIWCLVRKIGSKNVSNENSYSKWRKLYLCLWYCSFLLAYSFALAIFWIKKDDISEKIGHEWFKVGSSILILITFMLFLFGRPTLSFYFYSVISVGTCFSIAFSNSFFFTKLVLTFMIYFLGRMFDSGSFLGKVLDEFDKGLYARESYFINKYFINKYFVKDKLRTLRFYIDEAEGFDDKIINFKVIESDIDAEEIPLTPPVRYNRTDSRKAYHIHNIQSSYPRLNIEVNGETKDYPLNEVPKIILVQTPKLLNGIILTMTFLDGDKKSKKIKNEYILEGEV